MAASWWPFGGFGFSARFQHRKALLSVQGAARMTAPLSKPGSCWSRFSKTVSLAGPHGITQPDAAEVPDNPKNIWCEWSLVCCFDDHSLQVIPPDTLDFAIRMITPHLIVRDVNDVAKLWLQGVTRRALLARLGRATK